MDSDRTSVSIPCNCCVCPSSYKYNHSPIKSKAVYHGRRCGLPANKNSPNPISVRTLFGLIYSVWFGMLLSGLTVG